MILAVLFFAQQNPASSPSGGVDLTNLIDIGVIGLVLVLLLTKRLAPYWVVESEREARLKAEKARDEMIVSFQTEVIPALTRSSDALATLANSQTKAG